MSIQSNTNSLQAEQTELQSLLDAVNALPDAGSGGGASVETCTVSISGSSNGGVCIITQLVDGEITVNTLQQDGIKEDVVCGSGLYLRGSYLSCSVSAGEVLYCGNGFCYQVPKIKGATVNITLIRD